MNSSNAFSSCFESNYDDQEQEICKYIEKDQRVTEFPDLIESQDERFKDDVYESVEQERDLAIISDKIEIKYPEFVFRKAIESKHRVEFGLFSMLKYYTCTIDNQLYLWPIDQPIQKDQQNDNIITITEDCELITCVACGKTQKRDGFKIDSPYIIIVVTNRSFSLYPVIIDKGLIKIQPAIKLSHSLPLLTAITVSPTGHIFVGDNNGDIYLLSYKTDFWDIRKYKLYFKHLTYFPVVTQTLKTVPLLYPFVNWVSKNAGLTLPIKQLALCQLKDECFFIASLNTDATGTHTHLNFYYFDKDNETLKKISSYFPDKKHPEKLVKIVSIPISESRTTHFVAFTETSDRIFFIEGTNPTTHQYEIKKYKIRLFVSQLEQEKLVDANYSLGVSIFIYQHKIALTKTTQSVYYASLNPIENILIKEMPQVNNFVIFRNQHCFNDYDLQAFNNDMIWQHILEKPPPAYLMTSAGVLLINFTTPADQFYSLLKEQHWAYTFPIKQWLRANSRRDGYEASCTALLLSQQRPEHEQKSLRDILSEFEKERLTIFREVDDHTEKSEILKNMESINAFLLRCARLLTPIWTVPVFQLRKSKDFSIDPSEKFEVFQLHPVYDQIIFEKYIASFFTLQRLVQDYANLFKRSGGLGTTKEQAEERKMTIEYLQKFGKYLGTIISTLTFLKTIREFIKIIKEQPKANEYELNGLLTTTINRISEKSRNRLLEKPFYSNEKPSLYESLREFAATMFTSNDALIQKDDHNQFINTSTDQQVVKDDTFMKKIIVECPDFFNKDDAEILSYMDSLQKVDPNHPDAERQLLEKACQTFCKYAPRVMEGLILHRICQYFNNLYFFKGTVQVIIERASILDPSRQALSWYKNGRLSDDKEGREAFDKCYNCYQYAFQIANNPDAFNDLISATDELFHYCLYHYIIYELNDESILKLLLSLKGVSNQSCHQYLYWYLTQMAPQHLWLFQSLHKQYEEAARSILELVSKPNKDLKDAALSFDDRLSWLLRGIGFARASGNSNLLIEIQRTYNIASVQKEYYQHLKDEHRNEKIEDLMTPQSLFDNLTSDGYWDSLLKLFAIVPINTARKENAISQVWENYLITQDEASLSKTQNDIVYLVNSINKNSNINGTGAGNRLENTNDVLNIDIIAPLFENYKNQHEGDTLWACDTLLKCGIRPYFLFKFYSKLLKNPDFGEDKKPDCFYILLYLNTLHKDGPWDVSILKEKVEWFRENVYQQTVSDKFNAKWYVNLNLDEI